MPVYLCKWPNGTCSVVKATSKSDAILSLDEWDGASEDMLVRLDDFMADFEVQIVDGMPQIEMTGFALGESTHAEMLRKGWPLVHAQDEYNCALGYYVTETDRPEDTGTKPVSDARFSESLEWALIMENGKCRPVLDSGNTLPTFGNAASLGIAGVEIMTCIAAFQTVFGRDPNPEDPLFFDTTTPDKVRPASLQQRRDAIISAMKASGVLPDIIRKFETKTLDELFSVPEPEV